MRPIRVMPPWLQNQIAAGEVVERPAAAVKELVENSLDAGATQVLVQYTEGGKTHIKVVDDGAGMDPENAQLALERHATSKLMSLEDLRNIRTFGFRGEALPSIASVSRFTLRSRPAQQAVGTQILVDQEGNRQVSEVAMAPGTEIVVDDLFYNVPARKKFLKSEATEAQQIVEVVQRFALMHHNVQFTLETQGRTLISAPPESDPIARIHQIFGKKVTDHLYECFLEGRVQVKGFISDPALRKKGTGTLFLFVNSRFVRDKVLLQALRSGYGTLLPTGDSPYAILNVDVPPSELDVNVHPMKAEVRFSNSGEVFGAVSKAVKLTMAQNPHVARAVQQSLESDTSHTAQPAQDPGRRVFGAPIAGAGLGGDAGVGGGYHTGGFGAGGPDGTGSPHAGPGAGGFGTASPWGAPQSQSSHGQGAWGQTTLPLQTRPNPPALSGLTEEQRTRTVVLDERWMGYSPNETQDALPLSTAPGRPDDVGNGWASGHPSGAAGTGDVDAALTAGSNQPGHFSPGDAATGAAGGPGHSKAADQAAFVQDYVRPRPVQGMGLGAMRYLGQYANCFLLGQLGRRLVVVDQHAAHERVLFEQLRADWGRRRVVSQGSLTPILLEVEPRILAAAMARQELLEKLGFRVELFGNRKLALHSAPALFRGRSPVATLFSLLDDLPENGDINQTDLFHKPLSTVACHAAVRAGDPMEVEEVRQLFQLMDTVDLAAFCPHGRPVVVFLEEADVAKWFKRT